MKPGLNEREDDRYRSVTSDATIEDQPRLAIKELSKSYGNTRAIDELNLEIASGEVVGVLGANGAGKTTLAQMICGLVTPERGSIAILGADAREDLKSRRKLLGYCPQEIALWPMSTCLEQLIFVGELLDLPATVARDRADELLRSFDLDRKRNARPPELSGGMRRLLNLALSVVHRPNLLVLDEPFTELDPTHRRTVREFLRAESRDEGRTIIVTSNIATDVERLADRVVVLDDGRLLAYDTPEGLSVAADAPGPPSLESAFLSLIDRRSRA